MEHESPRIVLMDANDESRRVMARRLIAQGYVVDDASDAATGANFALSSPPRAVIADLWMPGISGVQLCRLLKSEAATRDVPVILRGDQDPRSRFWAERAGAAAYVHKGRMGELMRALAHAIAEAPASDGFFLQLSESIDVRDRIARQLDAALFESVIASEVRALASCGSVERLFDSLTQFLAQVINYRWVALLTESPSAFAVHAHPHDALSAEAEARLALGVGSEMTAFTVIDEDAIQGDDCLEPCVANIPLGASQLGRLALCPAQTAGNDTHTLVALMARELAGPLRIAALMDESRRMAAIDALTGIANRRAFVSQGVVEVNRARRYQLPLSVLMMDVDHFKQINDKYGHATGDRVLNGLGLTLKANLRMPDIPARWGGEEFVVALPNTALSGAETVAERLREAVEQTVLEHEGARVPITISIGVAEVTAEETLEAVLERADHAMYEAKSSGRNRVKVSDTPRLLTGAA